MRSVFITLAAAVVLCGFDGSLPALADSHDERVYQRYTRSVTPGNIRYEFQMKFSELGRPARQQEVEQGKAIFTFDGLGASRVWKLPVCPMFCEWPSLKVYRIQGQSNRTNLNDSGYVCQAEELQIDGQWKRYFGIVFQYGVAVVPAEEVYLWFDFESPGTHIAWTQLPSGVDWGMLGPGVRSQDRTLSQVKFGDTLPVRLYLRNRSGVPQKILQDLYRQGQNGAPAFRKGINLSLAWAPFAPKNPDPHYPQMEDFKPVAAFRTNFFTTNDPGAVLVPGEVVQRAALDLRDWFNVTNSGYYHFHFEFNPAELGLATNEGYGPETYVSFTVGAAPKLPSVEELNQDIPILGTAQRERMVRELIVNSLTNTGDRSGSGLPLPGRFPTLNRTPDMGDYNPHDSQFVGLWVANHELLWTFTNYNRAQLRARLESMMLEERTLPMKLLLASEVAPLGSQPAALFLLQCMSNTDYTTAVDVYSAIRYTLLHYEINPPAWLVQLAMAALSDERYATGPDRPGVAGGLVLNMSYVADSDANLAEALGTSHATNAVPFLIEMAGKPNGWFGSVWALGNIGDPRAIPPLIDMVRQKSRQTSGGFSEAVNALGALHAKDAVPVLLEHIELTDVIEALDEIGDATVIPALQKVVDSNGAVERAGVNNDEKTEKERLVAARIAVASLDPVDRTAKLCPLLTEPSFVQFQRRAVVWGLGRQPDPRAIPFLAKAIKN